MFANKTRQTHITYQAYNVLNQLRHWDIPEFRRITTHYWWHCWQVIVNSLAIQKNVPIHTAIIVTIDSVCTTEPLMVWASPQIAVASQLWLWRHSTDIDRRAGSSTQLSNALQCSPMLSNALQCSPMLSNALQCSPMLSNALQCSPMLKLTMQ